MSGIVQIVVTKNDDRFKVTTFSQKAVLDVSFHPSEASVLDEVGRLVKRLRKPTLKRLPYPE